MADLAPHIIGEIEPSTIATYGNFTAMAIPDYLAGLVFGLTGDNQLEEFEKCFSSSSDLEKMGEQVYHDFAAGEIIHAFEDLGTLASMIPPLTTTCSSDLKDDIKEIGQWAEVFHHPGKLIERVAKNLVLYHFQINHDFAKISSDWKSEDFFGSGEVTADFLTKVLTEGMPVSSVAHVIEGFLYGFVQAENLHGIEGCVKNGEGMVTQIESGIADFKKGTAISIPRGILTLKNVVSEIPDEIETCKSISADFAALKDWSGKFSSKASISAAIAKNMALHHKKITADISSIKSDESSQEFFKMGEDIAQLMADALGPVEKAAVQMEHGEYGMPIQAPPLFAAGFLMEFV
jgi:hypothetical protein